MRAATGTEPKAATLTREDRGYRYAFAAMASPCEVRIDSPDADIAAQAGAAAEAEAVRIERKYSRYRPDSAVTRINVAAGAEIKVDDETADLIDFAAACFAEANGLFDITSGVLRRVWRFDGSDRIPMAGDIAAIRELVGWSKALWRRPVLKLAPGMEIDLGGLGKEYAVDCALARARAATAAPVLVNFGGDLRVSGPRADGAAWKVGIASVQKEGTAAGLIDLAEGALATSGDANRYLLKDGVRYSHILDPRSGWPVKDPPRSVTVAAATCIEAGSLATFAMLQGVRAEAFLKREAVRSWCIR